MLHLKDQDVLILGLGASGLAMARWCVRHGARVTVADTREQPPQLAVLWSELPSVTFIGGPFSAELVQGGLVRAVYLSPGLAPAATAVVADAARAIGLPVGGELDLFARALADLRGEEAAAAEPEVLPLFAADSMTPEVVDSQPPELSDEEKAAYLPEGEIAPPAEPEGYRPAVIAITGTNGKTTVTSLTGQLVERAGRTVAVAGNIGPTLLDTLTTHIDAGTLPDVWVLELSSFQLDDVTGFEPTAATVAPTLVPLLSSKYSTPSTMASGSTRCGSPRYSRRPYSIGASGQPAACARARAARALTALCRPRMRSASAGIRRWMWISSASSRRRLRVSSASWARTSQVMPFTLSMPKSPGRWGMSPPKVTCARCWAGRSRTLTGGGSMAMTAASSRLSTIRPFWPKMRALAAP